METKVGRSTACLNCHCLACLSHPFNKDEVIPDSEIVEDDDLVIESDKVEDKEEVQEKEENDNIFVLASD